MSGGSRLRPEDYGEPKKDHIMRDITLEELLSAGCHFGHQVNRRNPKADDYIFEARSNVHIINLEKTKSGLLTAGEFIKSLAEKGGSLIVVGTKRQATAIVKEELERAQKEAGGKLYSVTAKWVGGTLTNFSEITKNVKKLKDLNELLSTSRKDEYTKREQVLFERERQKLLDFYGGVSEMTEIPDALFIVGTQGEDTAVSEATRMDVTTVGITDTNADPYIIDYPIPANDDAVGSIKLITNYLMDAWIEGTKIRMKNEESRIKAENQEKEKADAKAKKEKANEINRKHNS